MPPVARPPAALSATEAADLAETFRAASNPGRAAFLLALAGAGGLTFADLQGVVGLGKPAVSHHLAILAAAGLVDRAGPRRLATYALSVKGRRVASAIREAGERLGA